MSREDNPILVTGSHRSGSTWAGRMLALAPGVGYIQEPFSPGHSHGIFGASISLWFEHVHEANEQHYLDAIRKTLRFDYQLRQEARRISSMKDAGRMIRDFGIFSYHRAVGSRPLLKDPIAFFSAEWLSKRFDMEVLVLTRHPAAFVGSIKRLDWSHDFRHFTAQRQLMSGLLEPYKDEIARAAKDPPDIIEQAALLWKIFAGVTESYRRAHPTWIFQRHEDLALYPISEFKRLYERLNLEFTPRVREKLTAFTERDNEADVGANVIHELRRDSRGSIWTWTDRLSRSEIERIATLTHPEWTYFYEPEDWGEFHSELPVTGPGRDDYSESDSFE